MATKKTKKASFKKVDLEKTVLELAESATQSVEQVGKSQESLKAALTTFFEKFQDKIAPALPAFARAVRARPDSFGARGEWVPFFQNCNLGINVSSGKYESPRGTTMSPAELAEVFSDDRTFMGPEALMTSFLGMLKDGTESVRRLSDRQVEQAEQALKLAESLSV